MGCSGLPWGVLCDTRRGAARSTTGASVWRTPSGRQVLAVRAAAPSPLQRSSSSPSRGRIGAGLLGQLRKRLKRDKDRSVGLQIGIAGSTLTPTEQELANRSLFSNVLSNLINVPPTWSQVFKRTAGPFDPPTDGDVDNALQLLPDFPCSLQDAPPKAPLELDIHSLPLSLQLSHPTLQLLRRRIKSGSRPGRRRDGCKLGLVVEGGGMRGVITGGMLMGLHELGLRDAIDTVYGSSAGAINSTYFLSGQPHGLDIYVEDIANEEFLSLRRFFGRDPVMNLDFLIDYVMNEIKPLDWQAVLESPVPLKVIASSLDELTSVILHNFSTPAELAESLKASANVPEIAGPPKVINGHRLVDAAVFEPVPYRAAIRDGCTHVLALCSHTQAQGQRGPMQKVMKRVVSAAVRRIILKPDYMKDASQARLNEFMENGGVTQNELLLISMLQGLKGRVPSTLGGQVLPIYPPPQLFISPTCTDPAKLKAGAENGRLAVFQMLEPLVKESCSRRLFPF